MEQGVNGVIVNELSIQFKNLGLIDECINDVKNALVDISKVCKEEQENIDEAYQRGLTDAWEAARKIVEMSDPPYWDLFDEYKENLFGKISASEAIEKLKAYEEKQKSDGEIKRGDEVEHEVTGLKYIVTRVDENSTTLLYSDGSTAVIATGKEYLKKTDKHYDIEKILDEMKE